MSRAVLTSLPSSIATDDITSVGGGALRWSGKALRRALRIGARWCKDNMKHEARGAYFLC